MKESLTKRLARIAIFSCILFVQEELMMAIPNIQFTQCLISIYCASFGVVDTIFIVLIHCFLDNFAFGSFSIMYTPAMFLGWLSLVLVNFIFRKRMNKMKCAIITSLHGFIYSWFFLIVSVFIYDTSFWAYFIADLPFEILLVFNGFVTTYLLYDPLTKTLNKLMNKK